MKVLFDHNVPKKLRPFLPGHFIKTSRELGWDTLENGDLLKAGETNGYDVMITGDKNLSYQQNLVGRKLALIVLETTDWNILKLNPASVAVALKNTKPGSFQVVAF